MVMVMPPRFQCDTDHLPLVSACYGICDVLMTTCRVTYCTEVGQVCEMCTMCNFASTIAWTNFNKTTSAVAVNSYLKGSASYPLFQTSKRYLYLSQKQLFNYRIDCK